MRRKRQYAHRTRPGTTLAMPKPWDVPARPATADFSEQIYFSVGKALSNWELVEQQLGEMFSMFIQSPVSGATPLGEPAIRAYGSVVSFSSRADMLEAAARGFFHTRAAPDVELAF